MVGVPFRLAAIPTSAKQLSARELFYAAPVQTVAAKKAPGRKAHPAAEDHRERGGLRGRRRPRACPTRLRSFRRSIRAVASGVRLGLRYTVLKRVEGEMVAVAPDATFRAGDRIQISVEANDNGYLYIVHQGSSGTWKPLFPSAEIEDGNNRVEKGRTYIMPPGSRFYFDEQAGEEKLFLILSRQPEADLEKIIYSLQAPAAAPEPARKLYASAAMAADRRRMVGRLRNVYARDLVIEKVDDDAPRPAQGEGRLRGQPHRERGFPRGSRYTAD